MINRLFKKPSAAASAPKPKITGRQLSGFAAIGGALNMPMDQLIDIVITRTPCDRKDFLRSLIEYGLEGEWEMWDAEKHPFEPDPGWWHHIADPNAGDELEGVGLHCTDWLILTDEQKEMLGVFGNETGDWIYNKPVPKPPRPPLPVEKEVG